MTQDPWLLLLLIALSAYVAKLWLDDFRSARAGKPNPKALPGCTSAPPRAIAIACLGAIVLLALETWGEIKLGISAEQSTITGLLAFYTLFAAVVEEIIFRGFIVLDRRGTATLWISVFIASLLFAALHPFLWRWENGLIWQFTPKAWFSTAAIFFGSLWFYAMRFSAINPQRSLIPCFAAHLTKNVGVIIIKASQGFLAGWI